MKSFMQRVSTNLTLFFKFFVPIFWTVFFGSLTVAVFVYGKELAGTAQVGTLKYASLGIFLSGVALFYFTIFQLKRVDIDDQFLYVTNYFKTVRYPFPRIQSIYETRFLFLRLVTVIFKDAGHFGKRIRFLASSSHYDGAWTQHPDLKGSFSNEE